MPLARNHQLVVPPLWSALTRMIVLQVLALSTSLVASHPGEIGKLLRVPLETLRLPPHLLAPHLAVLYCLVVVLEEERRMDATDLLLRLWLLVTL
jgi:hypothetical protein